MSGALLAIDDFLGRLQGVTAHGDYWQAKCPAHEDHTASLSVSVGRESRILLKCHAGCETNAIRQALGLEWKHITPPPQDRLSITKHIVATYDYRDASGVVRYQSVRYEPKAFTQRRSDGNGGWIWNMKGVQRVPYRLNELVGQEHVYVVEGEKDADALWDVGVAATTNVGGAGKWRPTDSEALRAAGVRKCTLVPDNDVPGRKHMIDVERSLRDAGVWAVRVELVELPIKGDVSDWLKSGRSIDEIQRLADRRPKIAPAQAERTASEEVDPFGPSSWNQSEVGAAEYLVHRFGNGLRYNHKHKEWLVWRDHHWKADASEEVRRKAIRHIRLWQEESAQLPAGKSKQECMEYTSKLERRSFVDNIINLAQSIEPCADTGSGWDSDPLIVGCPNGIIDLASGALREGVPQDRVTLQTGVPFDVDAPSERWQLFLREVFCDNTELIDFIQRAAGYSLSGETHEQCFFMCVGSGANGKSTFLSMLGTAWGEYSYTTDTNVFATSAGSKESTPFDLAELLGRRLVMMSETKASSRMNEQALKNFTGGERINAQKKFGHPFEFQPIGKLWMGVNHQPKVFDDSHGFWRRVRLIPFERTFSGSSENRHLKRELTEELPGILAWAVRGCRLWLERGLDQPLSVMNATAAYQDAEDPIADFISECTEPSLGAKVPCSGTYLAYRRWAHDQGMSDKETLQNKVFGRLMCRRYEQGRNMTSRFYIGLKVKLRPDDMLSKVENYEP